MLARFAFVHLRPSLHGRLAGTDSHLAAVQGDHPEYRLVSCGSRKT
ncbi:MULTISPECIES: hypothetical protein [Sphingomonas]|nr:hypothetical protein [Sphingomonas faeni]MCK8456921.1 hypothetical protein [Sphingomonas faeni]